MTVAISSARSADLGVSQHEKIDAIFSNPALYTIGEGLSRPDATRGGRPRKYPDYLVVGFACLADICGSGRSASTALAGPVVWDRIRELVRAQFSRDPSMWLPEAPPSRTWYYKARNRLVDQGVDLDLMLERFTDAAIDTALHLGLLDPNGGGSRSHPDPTRVIYHDGKVIPALFRGALGAMRDVEVVDAESGEKRVEQRQVRYDPDAASHMTGDKRQIHGLHYWHAAVRGALPHSRVTLAVAHVPDVRGEHNSEADIAVEHLTRIAKKLPGAQAFLGDTALRGVHIDQLHRETGRIVINPVAARSVDPKTGDRTEKEILVRVEEFHHPDGTTTEVPIWSVGGRLCREDYADDGTRVHIPLERTQNTRRRNADGTYRTYVNYEVPDPHGGEPRPITEPTFDRPGDTFNRAENIRDIPPGDPDYDRLYGLRSDAEAANRQIDDQLYLRRARSLGARRGLFDRLAHALVQNSVARHRHPGAVLAQREPAA